MLEIKKRKNELEKMIIENNRIFKEELRTGIIDKIGVAVRTRVIKNEAKNILDLMNDKRGWFGRYFLSIPARFLLWVGERLVRYFEKHARRIDETFESN